ncbi:hypothetical protein HY04AAS1_0226 [Hydrogenobaculum sp. Y04AAS1]|nr:hypothetical protein HY04AAS1_0226 [Hydrogenobaculum sp. Y04AAS1]
MNTWKALAKQQMAFSHYSGAVVIVLSIIFAIGMLAILAVALKSK